MVAKITIINQFKTTKVKLKSLRITSNEIKLIDIFALYD